MSTSPKPSSRLRFDGFEVDLRSNEVWKNGIRVRLQDQPFQVLRVLLEHPAEIVTRDELKQTLWSADTFVDFDDGLNTAIKKIRELLGDTAERPRYIETIPRRGYRFVGSLQASVETAVTATAPGSGLTRSSTPAETSFWRKLLLRPAGYASLAALALILALIGADIGRWRERVAAHVKSGRIESLAVLPLTNLSRDPDQDYFADGMTEALIANLAQVRALRVISRTSAMHYKGTTETLPQIARDLNVDAVIEGTVQRSGDRVRVTAELIRAQTEAPLWAKVYERDSQDVLVMQSEVAEAIVGEIKVHLTPQDEKHLTNARPVNPDAYDAYLLAEYHSAKRNPAAIDKAIEYFHKAIRMDPTYAQAYAGLANAYFEQEVWAGLGIGSNADHVRANTLKALELDGELAAAHELLGRIHFEYDWDWGRAEAEFKRAVDLNANLPSSYDLYAFYLQAMGRHQEALATMHRAVELDPLSAQYVCDEGRILYRARQYDKAIARYERVLELDPGYVPVFWRMAEAYEQLGRYNQALVYVQKHQQATGDPRLGLVLRARMDARMGKRREAAEALSTLEKANALGDEYQLASVYSSLGERDRAIAELEKAVERHSSMPFMFVDPQLDPLRSDPRFQEMVRRVGLPL